MNNASHVLPRDKGAAPLDFVIAVMAFLAALALGASLIADRAAQGWQSGLAAKLTVQILPPDTGDARAGLDAQIQAALDILNAAPGVAHAALISDTDTEALVEPWIGKNNLVAEIPLPRLIDVTIIPGEQVNIPVLTQKLKQAAPQALLDDHRSWIARLGALADTVRYSAYGILLLIAGATAAAVSFATRAGLSAHHEMVELLHQMGALPSFIARMVEWHYFTSALMAALTGTLFAAVLFLGAGGLERFGVEAVPFLPPLALKWTEIPWLATVPAATSLIAWATARISVLSVVRAIY
jgi:cell division transport system permease protein